MKALSKRNRSALIGVLCGVLCAVCVGAYVMQVDQQANAAQADMLARYGGDQVEVCVARRDIAAGQTIADGDLETKLWIASLLPADAVVKKEEAVGQQVGSSILQGEVISKARFGFDAASIEVPDGLVALSVPARAVQAVGGALAPGMNVDVYAVGGSSTSRIAQKVPVLETCAGEGSASADTWVTLALQPQMVAQMVSAAENLELYFVLPSESAAAGEAQVAEAQAKASSSSSAAASSSSAQKAAGSSASAASKASSAASSSASSAASSVARSSSGSASAQEGR